MLPEVCQDLDPQRRRVLHWLADLYDNVLDRPGLATETYRRLLEAVADDPEAHLQKADGPKEAVERLEETPDGGRWVDARDSDDTADIARNMAENAVRRLPVVDDNKRLVGMVAITDIAERDDENAAGDSLAKIKAS